MSSTVTLESVVDAPRAWTLEKMTATSGPAPSPSDMVAFTAIMVVFFHTFYLTVRHVVLPSLTITAKPKQAKTMVGARGLR